MIRRMRNLLVASERSVTDQEDLDYESLTQNLAEQRRLDAYQAANARHPLPLSGSEETEDELLVLDDNPQLDDALILRLTYDLATKLHKPEIIARRYGLGGRDELRRYLREHPTVVNQARKLRAMYESDAASEDRVRMKFLQATEELIIPIAGLVADPRTPLAARIDGFKQIQRGAGLDGLSANAKNQQQRDAGQPFNLTISFAGGREVINATTVVEDEIPPAPSPFPLLGDDEEGAEDTQLSEEI